MKRDCHPDLFCRRYDLQDEVGVVCPDLFRAYSRPKYSEPADPMTANPPGTSGGIPMPGLLRSKTRVRDPRVSTILTANNLSQIEV